MGAKLVLWHLGRNMYGRCLRTVLRRIFGLKGNEMTGGRRNLLNEELHDLYSLSSIIRIMKLRRMGWTGHVA
jgi:hypothetical protein